MPEAAQQPENIIWSIVDGEALLLDLDTGNHFSLNPVATEIWIQLRNGETIGNIAAAIALKYGIASDIARADIEDLVRKLRETGIYK